MKKITMIALIAGLGLLCAQHLATAEVAWTGFATEVNQSMAEAAKTSQSVQRFNKFIADNANLVEAKLAEQNITLAAVETRKAALVASGVTDTQKLLEGLAPEKNLLVNALKALNIEMRAQEIVAATPAINIDDARATAESELNQDVEMLNVINQTANDLVV